MASTYSDTSNSQTNDSRSSQILPTDNINFLFDFIIEDTDLSISDTAEKLERLLTNFSNPNKVKQFQNNIEYSFSNYIKRIPEIFNISLKEKVKINLINESIFIQYENNNIELYLKEFRYLDSLIDELKRINFKFDKQLFTLSFHPDYENYKYYPSHFLEFNSNLRVEYRQIIQSQSFEIPQDMLLSDIYFENNSLLNLVEEESDFNTYLTNYTDENYLKYFIDKEASKIYFPYICIGNEISTTGVDKNISFNWCDFKVYHMSHESINRILKDENGYDLSYKGLSIYKKINELHSSVWSQ